MAGTPFLTSTLMSTVNYLLNFRLQWGKPDTLSLLTSALDDMDLARNHTNPLDADTVVAKDLPPLPEDAPPYFTADIPPEYISIIQNDWPYSGELHHPYLSSRKNT